MVARIDCLLFIAIETNTRSRNTKQIGKTYGLLLKVPKISEKGMSRVRCFFMDADIEIIQNSPVNPPANIHFEAVKVKLQLGSDGSMNLSYPGSAAALVKQLERRSTRARDPKTRYSLCPAVLKETTQNEITWGLIERLVAINPNMLLRDFRECSNWTLLHFATEEGYETLFEMLLRHGADVSGGGGGTKSEYAPIHLAVNRNLDIGKRLFFVQSLLKNGADVNHANSKNATPLLCAVWAGSLEVVQLLLEKEANVNVVTWNSLHGTPLHIAVRRLGNEVAVPMVKLLLNFGVDVEQLDAHGLPPSWYIRETNLEILDLLVEKGASVDFQSVTGETLLQHAVENSSLEIVEYILQFRPDPSVKGNELAFHSVLQNIDESYGRVANEMVQQGFFISPDMIPNTEIPLWSFIHGAIQKGLVDIVRSIIDFRPRVLNPEFGPHLSLLDVAFKFDHIQVARLLLNKGATMQPTSVEHMSVSILKLSIAENIIDITNPEFLYAAITRASPEVLEFLFEEGLDPNLKIPDLPLYVVGMFSNRDSEVIDILTRFGARFTYGDLAGQCIPMYLDNLWKTAMLHFPTEISIADRCILKSIAVDLSIDAVHHFIKLDVLNPTLKIIDEILNVDRKSYKRFKVKRFRANCELELKELSTEICDSPFTYRDILTGGFDEIGRFAKNETIVQAMEPKKIKKLFPIYADFLNCRFRRGIQHTSVR